MTLMTMLDNFWKKEPIINGGKYFVMQAPIVFLLPSMRMIPYITTETLKGVIAFLEATVHSRRKFAQ